jgi:hypothetical protein
MQRYNLLVFAALAVTATQVQAQGLLQSITTPDKAVAVVNQTLEGTWLQELKIPGTPATQPPTLNLQTFNANGTTTATTADGKHNPAHGVWVRVGDRKFLATVFIFDFDPAGALTTILKIRVNLQVSLDGKTFFGTHEIVLLDPTGKVLATIPGGSHTGVRLSPEITSDFYDFQKVQ